jgi:hypothetical protein
MDYQNGEYVDVPVIAFVGGTAAAVKYAINRLGFAGRELRSEDGNRRGSTEHAREAWGEEGLEIHVSLDIPYRSAMFRWR